MRPYLRECDVERNADFPSQLNELEGEVRWVCGEIRQKGVEDFGSEGREMWSRDRIKFEDAKSDKCEPPPVFAPFKISEHAQNVHEYRRCAVVGEDRLEAMNDEVANTGTALPLCDFGPEALVRKPFGGIEEGVLGEFEVYEVSFRGG